MGFSNLSSMLKLNEINIAALCDVDESVLKRRTADLEKAGIKRPMWYKDYRLLLENRDIDVVIIGTPDHWHCFNLQMPYKRVKMSIAKNRLPILYKKPTLC